MRCFTITRRKNADGAPLGVTVALIFPSVVRSSVTDSTSDMNADSLSTVALMRVRYKLQAEASILHCVFFGMWRPVFEFLRMRKRHMPILWEL